MYAKGKNVYILAGNHDWIKDAFVFEEGRKTCNLFENLNVSGNGNFLKFITEPLFEKIEGENVLFLPHVLTFNLSKYSGIDALESQNLTFQEMIKTENKNLILSAQLNLILEYFKKKETSFTVMHHYYIEGTKFPGQNSQFSLKDAAIQKHRLEDKEVKFISGHLHKGFFYKNYFCTGSVRATSPTESNQLKGIRKKEGDKMIFDEMNIKYYFVFDKRGENGKVPLSREDVQTFYRSLQEETKNYFVGKEIQRKFKEDLNLKDVNVTCYSDEMSYEEETVQKIIDPTLEKELHQFNIGKKLEKSEITLEGIENTEALITGMQERKTLLKALLQQKYPQQFKEYENLLQELEILK
ncbi:metallophosphoesterase [bacterium]|nr:metallophosphoesterase [bacterium]